MLEFTPGKRYGTPYKAYIWVCTNNQCRPFEKCDTEVGQMVYQTILQQLQQQGLTRKIILMNSSCILGCEPEGVTVAIATQTGSSNIRFFNNVVVQDVDNLIQFALN